MKTILTTAAFALLATATSEAQTDHRDRARERFCISCWDHETTMTMLEAKDIARRAAAEALNAQKREQAEAHAHAVEQRRQKRSSVNVREHKRTRPSRSAYRPKPSAKKSPAVMPSKERRRRARLPRRVL